MVQDYARAYSDAARGAYQRAIVTQVNASGNLSNGLIVAGALAAGLAAGSSSGLAWPACACEGEADNVTVTAVSATNTLRRMVRFMVRAF